MTTLPRPAVSGKLTATQGKAYIAWIEAEARCQAARDAANRANDSAKKARAKAFEVGAVTNQFRSTLSSKVGRFQWFWVPTSVFFAPGIREKAGVCHQAETPLFVRLSKTVGLVEQSA